MNNKKILLIGVGLAIICAVALIAAFQLNAVNKALRNDFAAKEQQFFSEKKTLTDQLNVLTASKKKISADLEDLQVKFDSLAKEKDSLTNRFDVVTKERAALADKLQQLARQKKEVDDELEKLKEEMAKAPQQAAPAGDEMTTSLATQEISKDDEYWAGVLKDKAALEIQVATLKKQLSDLNLKAETAMDEGRKLDLRYKTLTDAKSDLERRLVYNEKLAEALSEDLVREKRDKKALIQQLDALRGENFELKTRLMALGDKKMSLESKLVDLQSEREILAKRLSELDNILQQRVDQIVEVKDDVKRARLETEGVSTKDSKVVQLKPIVVKGEGSEDSSRAKGHTGQVLAVNEENNFVIVDIGEGDGIKVGQTLAVYRDMKKVATLEVIQTRKEISAADIKGLSPGAKIRVGDLVS